LSPDTVETIFARLKAGRPNPTTELSYNNPFELLVAVILSAQATDISVNKATKKLFAIANTPAAILALGEDGLKPYISAIGLYNSKARHIIATCQKLIDSHSGKVPDRREDLQRLPGVGRKTANVVLNVAFGRPTLAVDTHIFRVANRTGLASGKTPEKIEQSLLEAIPEKYLHDAHHWLILHGRYVCAARKPLCQECCIADLCEWPEKTAMFGPASAKGEGKRKGE